MSGQVRSVSRLTEVPPDLVCGQDRVKSFGIEVDDADPVPGWWRVVSDDRRLLHLVQRHGRADGGPMEALAPVAELFGVAVEQLDGGVVRVHLGDAVPSAGELSLRVFGERDEAGEVRGPRIFTTGEPCWAWGGCRRRRLWPPWV